MVSPIREIPIFLMSFEKDALIIALELCPNERARDAVLNSLRKSGMQDGNICFDALHNQYLQREIPLLMDSAKIAGSKLDCPIGPELMTALLAKIKSEF